MDIWTTIFKPYWQRSNNIASCSVHNYTNLQPVCHTDHQPMIQLLRVSHRSILHHVYLVCDTNHCGAEILQSGFIRTKRAL